MPQRQLHVIHILIRSMQKNGVAFLVSPHDKWANAQGKPYWTMPTKKSVADPFAPFLQGTSMEDFVVGVMRGELGLADQDYAIEQEIEPTTVNSKAGSQHVPSHYTIYPVDVWVDPARHEMLENHVRGQWLTCDQGLRHRQISPTAKAVFQLIKAREQKLDRMYRKKPDKEQFPEAKRRLLRDVPRQPSMDALAKKWFSENKRGVRHLPKKTLDEILNAGDRAFNLRVADPYLRYQQQGLGFTWSFFTHKDKQDCHVHGAPTVEIYGVLQGRLEVWWKPYFDRGTAAWCHRILEAGDWLEVDSLQCHIVRWLEEGQGVVFKAGHGPLAEVGKLGITGKTVCKGCPCMKPPQVVEMERGPVK